MALELPLPVAGSAYFQLTSCTEGLLEIEVRTATEGGGPRFLLWHPVIKSGVHLWVEYGALHFDAITPGKPSSPQVLSTQLPLRVDAGFDQIQLLVRRSSLDVAINGKRIGKTVEVPFHISPGMLNLGITKATEPLARVEYRRVAFYPAKGSSSETSNEKPVAPERVISAGEEIDLLAVTSLESVYRQGLWTKTSEGLRCSNKPPGSHKIEMPVHPKGEYDLDVEFTCSGLEPSFTMRLPLANTCADFTMASYGGKAIGIPIRHLSMMELPEPIGRRPSPVQNDRRHRAIAQVRQLEKAWSITGFVDGQEVIRWQGPPVELSLHEYWRSPDLLRPVLGQWSLPDASVIVHRAVLKVISGECDVMPQESRN